MKTSLFFAVIFILLSTIILAQEKTLLTLPEFGEVSPEHRDLTSIPEAPDADIVILVDAMDMELTPGFALDMVYLTRKKVLAATGIEKVNVRIPYYKEDKILNLKAQTILPNGQKIKVEKKSIFEEQSGNTRYKVFTFPAVEIGAIVEYTFRKNSEYVTNLEPWVFQSDEFTRLSHASILLLPGYNYNYFVVNVPSTSLEPVKEIIIDPDSRKRAKFTWQVENLQGLRDEPFVSTIDDYLAALYFQLLSYRDAYVDYTFIKTWNDMAEKVNTFYEPFIEQTKNLDDVAREQTANAENEADKIRLLYEYARDHFETVDRRYFLSDELLKPQEVYEKGQGAAVEKNLLLLNLLRHAGFDANPLLISTRSHGVFRTSWIKLSQFNHTIVHVAWNGANYYLDTAVKYVPFGLLPADDIVDAGLLVKGKTGQIIDLPQPKTINMINAQTTATLSEDGAVSCKTLMRYEDYAAMTKRAAIGAEDKDKYLKEWLEDEFDEVTLDSCAITNLDAVEMPLLVELDFHVANYCQVVDDLLYFSPSLLMGLDANPFKRDKRNFPVDFTYRTSTTEDVSIILPENYAIAESIPVASTQNDLLRFRCGCKNDSSGVLFQRSFMLTRNKYDPKDYGQLRNAYEKIVSADQGQIVLKKIDQQ